MNYEMSGNVKVVQETMTFSSGFSKREFVVTTAEQYPQDVPFEVVKDKTALLDSIQPGQKVTVHFNVRGREYNGRYFVNLNAWKIDTQASQVAASHTEKVPPMNETETFPWDETETPF